MTLEREVNEALRTLSRQLVPPEEYLRKREHSANKIFELLKEKSRFGLDRILLCSRAGGNRKTGAKISILNATFDCVVFVNLPGIVGIPAVLEDFEQVLMGAKLPGLTVVKRTQIALQLHYNSHDIDLVPAVNFVPRPRQQQLAGRALECEQAFYTLEMISRDPGKADKYSSSLAETHLRFMQQQSSFIQDLVRVCKFWTQSQSRKSMGEKMRPWSGANTICTNSLTLSMTMSMAMSTLIELIACYAGQLEETQPGKISLLNAFVTFLRLMEEFNSLKIAFLDFDPLKPARSIVQFPQLSGGQDGGLRKSRYVIEPANPFNNIAKSVSKEQIVEFQAAAGTTLWHLMNLTVAPVFKQPAFEQIFGPNAIVP